MRLRPYQLEQALKARESLKAGNKRILLQLCTGGGKTLIAAAMIHNAVATGRRVLFVAHRRELIHQAASKLKELSVGKILAGEHYAPHEAVQVGSIQTLESRFLRGSRELPPFDIIFIDEAHRAVSPTYMRLIECYPNAIVVGLTATPVRSDGKGLGNLFTDMVLGPSITDLTKQGYLVPVRYFQPSLPDLYGLKLVAGDYNQRQLDERMNRPKLVGDVIANWGRIAPDRKTVVFASSVDHSIHLAREFQREGVAAAHLDGETPIAEREGILRDLETGALQVVVNCAVLTEGWDMPSVSCCVLARPTKSLGLYLQCAGRVLRPAEGKEDTYLIDHSGAIREHGTIDAPFEWSLDTTEKISTRERKRKEREPSPGITCEKCSAVYTGQRVCPECGHTPTRFGQAVHHLEATLFEGTAKARNKRPEYTSDDKAEWYAMLRYHQQTKHYAPGWVTMTFKEKFGEFPDPAFNRLHPVYPSLEVSRFIRWKQIRHAKGRQRKPKVTPPLYAGND